MKRNNALTLRCSSEPCRPARDRWQIRAATPHWKAAAATAADTHDFAKNEIVHVARLAPAFAVKLAAVQFLDQKTKISCFSILTRRGRESSPSRIDESSSSTLSPLRSVEATRASQRQRPRSFSYRSKATFFQVTLTNRGQRSKARRRLLRPRPLRPRTTLGMEGRRGQSFVFGSFTNILSSGKKMTQLSRAFLKLVAFMLLH